MIDDSEDPWGVHQGVPKVVPKVQKGPKLTPGDAVLRPFWDLWDPLVGPPGVLTLVYHFLLLLCIRSV